MDKSSTKTNALATATTLSAASSEAALSKLFLYGGADIRDEFEEKYERAYAQLIAQTVNLQSDKELHDHLSALACKDKSYEDICHGLLYQILTDPQQATRAYRDLTLLTRDGLGMVTTSMAMLVAEKYQKLTETARRQALWALRELVHNQVLNVENIVWNIMRHAAGGDLSARNLHLVDGLLDILIDHRLWLEKHPFLVGAVVYTYVRLIEDHHSAALAVLRAKETKFVVGLIRDRFVDVVPLGRDFVRILQNVAGIPEFEMLWRDILHQPKTLLPSFTGIWQLLHMRTSRRFLQCRLTPEVERKVHFMNNSVKFGQHKRYQEWFQDKYFSTPESHTLRSDLIRFIVNAIHPTNDQLCSDIIPRWAIIGWLLTSCTNQTAMANAKLSLFYDWLVFDPLKDNIMNVEPGILLMWHSIRNHPLVSSTLLDFLCRIMRNFCAKSEDRIRAGVFNSLRKILEKQVIPNLQQLFESPRLDRELRACIRENFREFCSLPSGDPGGMGVEATGHQYLVDERLHGQQLPQHHQNQHQQQYQPHGMHHHLSQQHPHHDSDIIDELARSDSVVESLCHGNSASKFSDTEDDNELVKLCPRSPEYKPSKSEETDDDDDLPLSKVRLKEKPTLETVELPTALTVPFDKLVATRSGSALDALLADLRTGTPAAIALDADQEQYVVATLCDIVRTTLPVDSPFADSKSDERALQTSIGYPLFRLFRCMYQFEEKLKKSVVHLLRSVFRKLEMPCGHLMLYFLKVTAKLQSRKAALITGGGGSSAQTASGVTQMSASAAASCTAAGNAGAAGGQVTASAGGFKTAVYRLLCDYMDSELDVCLSRDLAELEAASAPVFLWLLPDVVREFKPTLLNNSDMLHTLVGCVDARGLRDLIYSVTQGKLTLFKNEGVLRCVRDSLDYETFEQYCLWQLVLAHDVPIEYLQDLLPDLESSNHAEALTYMLLMLKNEKPNTELTRLLLSREAKSRGDQFVTSALRYWCQDFEENLSEIIASLLTSKYPHSSPNKRKRPLKGNTAQHSSPTADQLLSHLEHFRRSCRHGNGTGTGLYVQDAMQRALQQAFSHSSDSTKKQYNDLFALAAEDDTSAIGRRGTSGRGRKAPANKKQDATANSAGKKTATTVSEPINNVLYSSDGESSEDDWTKPKTPKRRKKAISDSD